MAGLGGDDHRPGRASLVHRLSMAEGRIAVSRMRLSEALHGVFPRNDDDELPATFPRSWLFRTLGRHKGALLGTIGAIALAKPGKTIGLAARGIAALQLVRRAGARAQQQGRGPRLH